MPEVEDDWPLPVQNEENSKAAAEAAAYIAPGLRRAIVDHIRDHGPATCEEVHHLHPENKHQAVSAALNLLREKGVIWKVAKRANRAGNSEWVNDLSTGYRLLKGLPPGLPRYRPPDEEPPPRPPTAIVYATCTGCGQVQPVDLLSSKYGKPQLVGEVKGKRLWEARCGSCNRDQTKGLQAIWKEQAP